MTIPEYTGSFFCVQSNPFNSRNCLENCLGQPSSPSRVLIITLKHTNSSEQLANSRGCVEDFPGPSQIPTCQGSTSSSQMFWGVGIRSSGDHLMSSDLFSQISLLFQSRSWGFPGPPRA